MSDDRVYFVRAVGGFSGSIRWAATVAAPSARLARLRAVTDCPYPPDGFIWSVFRMVDDDEHELEPVLYAEGETVTYCRED